MKEQTTRLLLVLVAVLLLANLVRPAGTSTPAHAQGSGQPIPVLRAQAIELVDKEGKVVAQLHVGDDGGGNLRLRSGDGLVRVKLGATAAGSGLLLFDSQTEPALSLVSNTAGTSLTLAEKGKGKRLIKP